MSILSAKTGVSHALTSKGKVIISDTLIQSKVGIVTYRLLYYTSPNLYEQFCTCSDLYWKETVRNSHNTTVTDMNTWFLDTTYTPLNLKEDIIRVLIGEEPINQDAKLLIGSSKYYQSLNMTGWDWCITIFIMVIFSISVAWLIFARDCSGNLIFWVSKEIINKSIWGR